MLKYNMVDAISQREQNRTLNPIRKVLWLPEIDAIVFHRRREVIKC